MSSPKLIEHISRYLGTGKKTQLTTCQGIVGFHDQDNNWGPESTVMINETGYRNQISPVEVKPADKNGWIGCEHLDKNPLHYRFCLVGKDRRGVLPHVFCAMCIFYDDLQKR